jgi:hypothetical protein
MPTDEKRLSVARRFIEAAQALASQTRVMDAQRNWEYLHAHGMVVSPRFAQGDNVSSQAIWAVNRDKRSAAQPMLCIMPIFAEDAALNDPWKKIWHDRISVAMYKTGENFIYLRPDVPTSPFDQGCTTLHEAGHARRAFEENRIGQIEMERTHHSVVEEGDMQLLNARLYKERGGERYGALLQELVARIRKALGSKLGFFKMKPEKRWLTLLDELFEAKRYGHDLNLLWGKILLYAHLEFIQNNPWPDKPNLRAEFIRIVWQEIGYV